MIALAATGWMSWQAAPAWLVAGGVLLAASATALVYRLKRWRPTGQDRKAFGQTLSFPSLALAGARVLLAFLTVWLTLHLLGRIFLLRTNWPLWPMALAAVLVGEALIWLYDLERRVVSRKTGLALVGLRLLLLALVILMLIQPVLASSWTESRKRALPILVDVSASMLIADQQMPPHQKLRLAEGFSIPQAHRCFHLEERGEALRLLGEGLLPEAAWLDRLETGKKETIQAQLLQRRKVLGEKVRQAEKVVAAQVEAVEAVLKESPAVSQPLRTSLMDAKATLAQQVRPRLLEAATWAQEQPKDRLLDGFGRLREALGRAVAELAKVGPVLERAQLELDTVQYNQLSGPDKATVDAVAGLTRLELARSMLVHRPIPLGKTENQSGDSLLQRLRKQYDVKVYAFAGSVVPDQTVGWSDATVKAAGAVGATSAPAAPAPATTQPDPGAGDEKVQRTDLAAAVRKVLSELGGETLAGVLVLSDGQDNSRQNLEPLARQMGGQGGAFCALLAGSEKPPTDAAIIALDAPETVFLSDRTYLDVEIKLDGLANKDVQVTLLDGDQPTDSRTVHVVGDVYRTRVQLADEPKRPGVHAYRVEIEKCQGEAFNDNNAYSLTIAVTDEKTKVLMVDSRPRWEFRYLKNLFSGRDKTVRLQYLLLEPDTFAGQAPRPLEAASVNRPEGQEEATTMPAKEEEWLKFDVLVLGDVPPGALGEEGIKTVRKFVADRGGTAIFIAGPRYMPADLAGTALAELVPLRLTLPPGAAGGGALAATRPGQPSAVQAKQGFRIALTPAGRGHVICRQDVQPDRSRQIWDSTAPVYWRSPWSEVTPACTVLAYALDADAPKWVAGPAEGDDRSASAEDLSRMRDQYQREHALLAVAPHGLGKVMLLTFDQTWRLRYRVGDTYHHKFWGQVLRWATAGKLPAGKNLVKMGADRTRYPPHERPLVRAKMVREDFTPLVTDQAAVKIFSGEKLVGRVPMRYLKDSPGLYTATLDELPAGAYRLELDAPAAAELLARDGVKTVSMEISVDPSAPTEQIELAANRDLLARLASLSHNGRVAPVYDSGTILQALPAGKWEKTHSFQFELWDSWLLLVLFCAVATAEWVLRKRVGLA